MTWFDSHCHLDMLDDPAAALIRARDAGVGGAITIGTRLWTASRQRALCDLDTPNFRVWAAVGTHPDHVAEGPLATEAAILAAADHPGVVALGESGLDYFHGAEDVRPLQADSFRAHIAAARTSGLPLVIHARAADEDVAAILRDEHERGAFPFLLHCFASGPTLAETALSLGGYISFSGLLTFPKCGEIRDVARVVPADRLLVETDSPFLAPVPRRGKPNEPGYVAYTAQRLAQERGVEPDALADTIARNMHRLFSRMAA